ncbi:MAG: hypothetical protein WCK02_17585 [Bacteroidota bacterium]
MKIFYCYIANFIVLAFKPLAIFNNNKFIFIVSTLLFLSVFNNFSFAQTTLLDPTVAGGFENATSTFAANGWTQVGTVAPTWYIGTAGGAKAGTKAAFIGTDASTFGSSATSGAKHFYRDIAIPAGATNVSLTYWLKFPLTDNGYDYLNIYTTTTANTPVNGTTPSTGYTEKASHTATTLASFTQQSAIDLTSLAGTTVRLVFTWINDGIVSNAYCAIDNISITYTAVKAEPTNQPTLFACGTPTSSTIPLTWTDAASTVPPDGYLIKWSTIGYGSISAPSDGTAQADGASRKNIAQGVGSYTPTGLSASTTYYFQIWSYTNSGTSIDYKLTSVPQASATTAAITEPTTTWTGSSGTSWSNAGNWDNGVPTSTVHAIIPDVTNDPIISTSTSATCKDLTINSGGFLTDNSTIAGGGSLKIYGNWTNNGYFDQSGNVIIQLKGSGKTFGGTGNFNYVNDNEPPSIEIASGSSYTLSSDVTIMMELFLQSATSTFSLSSFTFSVLQFHFDDGVINLNTGTLEIGSYIQYTGGTINYNTGTVYFNSGDTKWTNSSIAAGNQTINSFTYYNLKVRSNNGYTATLGDGTTITINNDLTLQNPSTSGGIITTANTITLNGNLTLGNGGNGFTFNIGHRIARTTASGSGTFTMQNNDNIAINVTYADATNSAIALGSSSTNTSMIFYGTVTYNSASAQKLMSNEYKNLTLSAGTGIKSLTASTTVNGNLTLNADELALSTYTLTVTGTSDINKKISISTGIYDANGAFDATGGTIDFTDVGYLKLGSIVASLGTLDELTGTVSYDLDGSQSVLADNYYNLTIDGGSSSTKTALGNVNVAGTCIVQASTNYALAATTTAVTGTSDINGTLTISTGTFDANGTFDATGGTIDFSDAGFLNLGGATVTSLGTLDNAAGTVVYDYAGGQTILLDNYFGLKVDGSGTKTLGGAIDVDGNLTLAAGTMAVSGSNYGISLAGDWVNAGGAFTCGTGTVTLDGGSTQRINVTTAGGTTPLNADFTFYNVVISGSDAKFYYNQTNDRKINSNNIQINSSKSLSVISN